MPIAKPTDNILWAETPNVPGDVADPSTKRSAGWQFKDPPPSNAFNYLLRAAGRFCAFAADKFDATGEKLTLGADHAELEVATDTSLAVLWDFVGATINTVRATVFQADAFAIIGSLDPCILLRTYGEGTYTEDASSAALDFTHNDGGAFSLGAKNTPRMMAGVLLTADGANTAQYISVDGFNVGTPSIVDISGTRRLRVPFAAGNIGTRIVLASCFTNDDGRPMFTSVAAITPGTPAAVDLLVYDDAGIDVLGIGALASGEDIEISVIVY